MIFYDKKADRRRWRKLFREVFGAPGGREVLRVLGSECFVWRASYVRGDTHETARNEGAREVINKIKMYLDFSDEEFEIFLSGEKPLE